MTTESGNPIVRVLVIGQINQTAIDDLEICIWDTNEAPSAVTGDGYAGFEGSPISLDSSASNDPDGEIISHAWDFDGDGLFDDALGISPAVTYFDNGTYPVALLVTDNGGITATATTTVSVSNLPPVVDAGPEISNFFTGMTLQYDQATFTDPGSLDTHTATINWGDGSAIEAGEVVDGAVRGLHLYAAEGNYNITLCVSDDDGGEACDVTTISVEDEEVIYTIYLPDIVHHADSALGSR